MDIWVIVHVSELSIVYTWRESAEAMSRAAGKPALTPEQVRDFVDRFFPAYRTYLPNLVDDEKHALGDKPMMKVSLISLIIIYEFGKYIIYSMYA